MMHALRSLKSPLVLVAFVTAVLALAPACASDPTPTPVPTPTPTPSPTPTPVPVRSPILSLAQDAEWGDLVSMLSDDQEGCLRNALGSEFDVLLDSPIFGKGLDLDSEDFPVDCVAEKTVIDLFVAGLIHEAGGLTGESITCMQESFAAIDFREAISGGADLDADLGGLIGSVRGMLLCLTDDEAKRISVGGLFGDGEDEPSIQDLRCIVQRVDVAEVISMFTVGDPDGGDLSDLGQAVALLAAADECGLNIAELFGDPFSGGSDHAPPTLPPFDPADIPEIPIIDLTQLPPELQETVTCLTEALGQNKIDRMLAGTYEPEFADLGALSQCDLGIAEIGALLERLAPQGG